MRQVTIAILTLFLFAAPNLSRSQDNGCDIEQVRSLLAEVQTAQQNEKFDNAEELLETAIGVLNNLSQNCSIEPAEAEEATSPTPSSIGAKTPLTEDKDDGFYLVGIDISPGRWETTGSGSGCYWARLDISGDTLSNSYSYAGGTITIQEEDFQVEFDGCGTVVYVEDREPVLSVEADEPKESGFYTVGVEIVPGLWRSTGTGDGCYYARLDEHQDTIDNHYGSAGVTVNIQPTDYEVEFNDCGVWEYLGTP